MSWYLRTRYEDPRRSEIRERHYLDNGEVWFVVDGDRTLRCKFDAAQVDAARAAVFVAGLGGLSDIPATDNDLAVMVYEWNLAGGPGRWMDAAYPKILPDVVDRLEDALLRLEEAAG